MRRRNTKGYDPDTMTGRVPGCGIIRDGDASFFVSDIGLGDSANSDWFGIKTNTSYKCEFWLILPEVTAIEVRLSHASRM